MKTYTLSGAASDAHVPAHPERTGKRSAGTSADLNFDVIYREWPNRASLAKTIRLQERRERRHQDWRACVPLRETEGY